MVDKEARDKRQEEQDILEEEIESFEQDRENIRKIIGKIGGTPTGKSRIVNVVFIVLVLVVFAMSIMWGGKVRFFMIEVGILLLSIKLVYFLESYMRLNHFQFWILSSLEWRLDKIDKNLKQMQGVVKEKEKDNEKN